MNKTVPFPYDKLVSLELICKHFELLSRLTLHRNVILYIINEETKWEKIKLECKTSIDDAGFNTIYSHVSMRCRISKIEGTKFIA